MAKLNKQDLRTGFTTGACATAASVAACHALVTGNWMDPVTITLPRGQTPSFSLESRHGGTDWCRASVIKDAGDDPDVTHGAEIFSTVSAGSKGQGIFITGGEGVGTVTRPGLPVPVGEPAINPVPRRMICDALQHLARTQGCDPDFSVEISVPGGQELAKKTWNPRLGISGGISILGTTGIVRPFSCAAWISSIHRGIDVARAGFADHVIGSTGATSEAASQAYYGLPDWMMLDMGDFVGGMLKYLRRQPVEHLTIAGGFGKMVKLAQGARDLHSARSQVDFKQLARMSVAANSAGRAAADQIEHANSALEALEIGGTSLAEAVAVRARAHAEVFLDAQKPAIEVMIVNRRGDIIARAQPPGFLPTRAL